MYAYIKGKIEYKSSNYVVVDNMGIGYKIYMGDSAINTLGDIGEDVKIFTHYHVREDDISLYGFKTNEELRMFELLISVSGVGAKMAVIMLSNIELSSFALAVITNDTAKLVKIPGVGKKTAARIILELKDKLKTEESISNEGDIQELSTVAGDTLSEAVSALQVLGYPQREAAKAVASVNSEGLTVEEIIKKFQIYL